MCRCHPLTLVHLVIAARYLWFRANLLLAAVAACASAVVHPAVEVVALFTSVPAQALQVLVVVCSFLLVPPLLLLRVSVAV
jgi:hypothetical protein